MLQTLCSSLFQTVCRDNVNSNIGKNPDKGKLLGGGKKVSQCYGDIDRSCRFQKIVSINQEDHEFTSNFD